MSPIFLKFQNYLALKSILFKKSFETHDFLSKTFNSFFRNFYKLRNYNFAELPYKSREIPCERNYIHFNFIKNLNKIVLNPQEASGKEMMILANVAENRL